MTNQHYQIESKQILKVKYFKYFIENYKVKIDFNITEENDSTVFILTFKDEEERDCFNSDFRESIGFNSSFTN